MKATHHAALERALLFAVALAESAATLRRFEAENRLGLYLLPDENLARVRQAWRTRHALVTQAAETPASPSPSPSPSPPPSPLLVARGLQRRPDP